MTLSSLTAELCLTREARAKTAQKKTINLLHKKYRDRLTDIDFVEAVTLLESESKTRVFIALKDDDIRDRWLEKNISAELLSEISD